MVCMNRATSIPMSVLRLASDKDLTLIWNYFQKADMKTSWTSMFCEVFQALAFQHENVYGHSVSIWGKQNDFVLLQQQNYFTRFAGQLIFTSHLILLFVLLYSSVQNISQISSNISWLLKVRSKVLVERKSLPF